MEASQMDSTPMNEMIVAIYVALAHAAGGRALLRDANDILHAAVETGAISRPDTCKAIAALIAATSHAR
jgi:hypothetical protein